MLQNRGAVDNKLKIYFMNFLIITPFQIVSSTILLIIVYVFAISILIKNKSGILPYLVLLLIPILGSLGIIIGNFLKKKTLIK